MEQQAIQLFENTQVRMVWNEEEEKYYFSIADIVQILTDSEDVKQYIKRMRTRDPELNGKWGTICTPVRICTKALFQSRFKGTSSPYEIIQSPSPKNPTRDKLSHF